MNTLLWHVHGSWTTSFVQGRHLLPTLPERGPWGGGRPAAWDWPAAAPADLADAEVDVVVLQRPEELELAERWLGRTPGRDVPAVHPEHNAPPGHAATSGHPMADRTDLTVVHVTHFIELMWDCGAESTTVAEHGVVDPGHRYTRGARRSCRSGQRTGATDPERLADGLRELMAEPELAWRMGAAARRHAQDRYGSDRFRTSWDEVLLRATDGRRRQGRRQAETAAIGRS